MPIITGNKPIFRIRFDDVNIREVRKGNELEWGLYKISYVNKGPKNTDKENITNYVWGYPDYKKEDFYLYKPDDATAVESGSALGSDYAFRSHSSGWYSDRVCLNYIPAITRDFYKDLSLYCKWKQRRYSWNGVYKWMHRKTVETGYWVWVED